MILPIKVCPKSYLALVWQGSVPSSDVCLLPRLLHVSSAQEDRREAAASDQRRIVGRLAHQFVLSTPQRNLQKKIPNFVTL